MIKILSEKCDGCGTCIGVCPVNALLFMSETRLVVDPQKCVSCGACVEICPFGACVLQSEAEEKETRK